MVLMPDGKGDEWMTPGCEAAEGHKGPKGAVYDKSLWPAAIIMIFCGHAAGKRIEV